MSFESIIPGQRPITVEEMRMVRDMAQAGRSPAEIAARLPGVDEDRIAALLAPKRTAPIRSFTPRRRR